MKNFGEVGEGEGGGGERVYAIEFIKMKMRAKGKKSF